MGSHDGKLDPIWDEADRMLGQLFMMGFEGTAVTPQVCLRSWQDSPRLFANMRLP